MASNIANKCTGNIGRKDCRLGRRQSIAILSKIVLRQVRKEPRQQILPERPRRCSGTRAKRQVKIDHADSIENQKI